MKLFDFQQQAVSNVAGFIEQSAEIKKKLGGMDIDPCLAAWGNKKPPYTSFRSSVGYVPSLCVAIPTGGGKTLVGLSCVAQLLDGTFRDSSLCVWLVPNEAIYKQFLNRLKHERFYSDLEPLHGRTVIIKELDSSLRIDEKRPEDIWILLLTYQSIIRTEEARRLNIFKPRDDLSFLFSLEGFSGSIPSVFELIKYSRPLVVVDEAHHIYTELGQSVLAEMSPSAILELTATPKALEYQAGSTQPNIIFTASGGDLINNQLIKHPINFQSYLGYGIKELLKEVVQHQQRLERIAEGQDARFVPKVLISAEFTDKKFSGVDSSVYSVRDHLVNLGVPRDQIKIKSSKDDEISSIPDMDAPSVEVRYLLTKRALMEGWDCKSVYLVVLINKIGADITNIQLVGRGMRQPDQCYFSNPSLNALFVTTNSSRHQTSVNKLKTFLSEKGLSDIPVSKGIIKGTAKARETEFKLIRGNWNKLIPLVDIRDKSYLMTLLDQKKYDLLRGLKGFSRTTGYDAIPDKGIQSGKVDLKRTTADSWQFHQYVSIRPVMKSTLASALCKRIYGLFPNTRLAFEFIERQIDIWTKEGIDISDIDAKKEPVGKLLAGLIENELSACLYSSFISSAKSGQATIRFNKNPKFLPRTISYDVNESEQGLESFHKNIYGNIPKDLFNSQELDFAYALDSLDSAGWLRNDVSKIGVNYDTVVSRIYPDFFVFGKSTAKILVLIIETKGAHLVDSSDTKRKTKLFEALNVVSGKNIRFVIGTFESCQSKLKEWIKD